MLCLCDELLPSVLHYAIDETIKGRTSGRADVEDLSVVQFPETCENFSVEKVVAFEFGISALMVVYNYNATLVSEAIYMNYLSSCWNSANSGLSFAPLGESGIWADVVAGDRGVA